MTQKQRTNEQLLAEVMADLKKLTPEELKAEMEKAKDSDWGRIFQDAADNGFHLYMGPMPTDKENPDGSPA